MKRLMFASLALALLGGCPQRYHRHDDYRRDGDRREEYRGADDRRDHDRPVTERHDRDVRPEEGRGGYVPPPAPAY